MGPYTMQVLT